MPAPAAGPAAMRSRFVEDGVSAAPPQVLLISLYDRLLLDLSRGAQALREADRQVSHAKLINAQAIVTALKVALDGGEWEGTGRLQALYTYLLQELAQANMHMDADRVDACRGLVEPLREAWFQACIDITQSAPPSLPRVPSMGTTA